jgi:hypothetical protein
MSVLRSFENTLELFGLIFVHYTAMVTKIHYLLMLSVCLALFSCRKPDKYDEVPWIEYRDFEQLKSVIGVDSIGILHLYFRDGDGDFGLAPADTLAPFNQGSEFYYNFFISYYEKQNGTWMKITPAAPLPGTDTVSNNSRIPLLTPEGRIKTLEGDIYMELFTNNPFSPWDTIRYEVSVVDRALNRSNTIQTPDIILNK